jgi:hypothetical protein
VDKPEKCINCACKNICTIYSELREKKESLLEHFYHPYYATKIMICEDLYVTECTEYMAPAPVEGGDAK